MGGAKNCPETPRQKMIGMMYLVLTAMLALNVSAAILNGYQQVDDSLRSTLETTEQTNAQLYAQFRQSAQDNPEKNQAWYEKAMEVKAKSDEFYQYLSDFKDAMIFMTDSKATPGQSVKELSKKDDTNIPQQYAINEGHAEELKQHILDYAEYLMSVSENDAALDKEVSNTFSCNDGVNAEGKPVTWADALFHEMPLCACVTVLDKFQNDVRNFEGKMVQHLMQATDAGDLRVNKLNAYVIPKSDYVIRGAKYSAQIILAAIDSTAAPEYYVDGQRINDQGLYERIASGSGTQKFRGYIGYMNPATGEMEQLPFESEYFVSEPSVTISNNDLNIMYRGYSNKFSITVPGVNSDKVRVTANGASISKSGSIWIVKPTESAKTVTLSVSAEMDGKVQSMGSREYKVKPMPSPSAYLKSGDKEYSEGNVPRSALISTNSSIIASYGPDGLLDVPFKVTSFKVFLNGNFVESRSDHFTKEQVDKMGKLNKGSIVLVTDIRAKSQDGADSRLKSLSLILN